MIDLFIGCNLVCVNELNIEFGQKTIPIKLGQKAFVHSFDGPYVNIQLGESLFDDLPFMNMLAGDMDFYWNIDQEKKNAPPFEKNSNPMITYQHPDIPGRCYSAKYIGYWAAKENVNLCEYAHKDIYLPWPGNFIDKHWNENERKLVLSALRHFPQKASWKGQSRCRLCQKTIGSCDYGDDIFMWPAGFPHYIEEHFVKPPQEFIEYLTSKLNK